MLIKLTTISCAFTKVFSFSEEYYGDLDLKTLRGLGL